MQLMFLVISVFVFLFCIYFSHTEELSITNGKIILWLILEACLISFIMTNIRSIRKDIKLLINLENEQVQNKKSN